MKKALIVCLSLVCILLVGVFLNAAEKLTDAAIGDFIDNAINVTMTNEESLKFKEYTVEDFKEIDAISVYNYSRYNYEEMQALYRESLGGELPQELKEWQVRLRITIEGHSKRGVLRAIEQLNKREDVYRASVQPGGYATIYSSSASEVDANADYSWAYSAINAAAAWDITRGNSDVLVGVIDTGIDALNPYLADAISRETLYFKKWEREEV